MKTCRGVDKYLVWGLGDRAQSARQNFFSNQLFIILGKSLRPRVHVVYVERIHYCGGLCRNRTALRQTSLTLYVQKVPTNKAIILYRVRLKSGGGASAPQALPTPLHDMSYIEVTLMPNCNLFVLSLPPEVCNIKLFYGSQRFYGVKTTTVGTATRIKVKRHSNHPDLMLYGKVILAVVVVAKKQVARST